MARLGRKPKITDEQRKEVLACLTAGASLKDAADYIAVDYKTLYNLRRKDATFAKGVMQAVKDGKMRLLKKMGAAKPWQAAAWMLERRWGSEFGRKEVVKQEMSGSKSNPIQVEHKHEFDFAGFTEQFNGFARSDPRRNGSPVPSGNGH